jgi:hypothetical protein
MHVRNQRLEHSVEDSGYHGSRREKSDKETCVEVSTSIFSHSLLKLLMGELKNFIGLHEGGTGTVRRSHIIEEPPLP